jgi:nucleoside-diphosphate-sugar epimerase
MAKVLVTGGAGYLGGWCVVRLLQGGWSVRTTVRDLSREAELRSSVSSEVDPGGRLEVVKADLLSDDGWAAAVAGCDYVLHVASPFPASAPTDPDDLIRPAREGTLRLLRAAVGAGVRRVVVTSSVAAIAYGHGPERYAPDAAPMTEADWTNIDGSHVSAYAKSKTLAERAAREFIAHEGGATELVTVNPSGIFGPTIGRDIGTSLIIVQRLLKGALPGLPRLGFQVVDVRDTADLHVKVMTDERAAGGRYPATGEFLWFDEFARVLREEVPELAGKVPTRKIPDWVLQAYGLIDAQARAVRGELGRTRRVDAGASRALGWSPRPARETLADSARSLAALGAG